MQAHRQHQILKHTKKCRGFRLVDFLFRPGNSYGGAAVAFAGPLAAPPQNSGTLGSG
jgi:hypothetical protein